MDKLSDILKGYQGFRDKFHENDNSVMAMLAEQGQKPKFMVVACCDSRVDPAIVLQCAPGDLFVVRNIANLIPPYENDESHHGTSAALEIGVGLLDIEHLIIMGHSNCGGLMALRSQINLEHNDFVSKWVRSSGVSNDSQITLSDCAKHSINQSYENCFSFPLLKSRVEENRLTIHRWYFDIASAQIFSFDEKANDYLPLLKK